MRIVNVNKWQKALVFKNGSYNRMLSEGRHWLGFTEELRVYNMAHIFLPVCDLNILLQDHLLAAALHIVEVKDNEIVLKYENNNFTSVLAPGRHAFWKGLVNYRFVSVNLDSTEPVAGIETAVLMRREVISYIRIFNIETWEKGILIVNGKPEKELEPGTYYFWKSAVPVTVMKADMRQLQVEITGQEILTKDKAALRINFYAQYKIESAKKVLLENKEAEKQLYYLLQLALRAFIGSVTLDELLDKKQTASDFVTAETTVKAAEMGITLVSCGVRDIILPGDVKDIMNQVLVAEKKAQANTIMRREETASARSLLNTAKLMEENEMLFKLKEMEYVEKIADKINSISVSGGNLIVDQLKQIFVPGK
ncbi:MAG: slipin family protein [Bacteroidota bacterium]